MKAGPIIITVIVLLVIFFIIRYIRKEKKKKRDNLPAELLLNKQIEDLKENLVGRELFFDWINNILYDEKGNIINLPEAYMALHMNKHSVTSSLLPITISSIGRHPWSDSCDIRMDIDVRDDAYEFEICYVGYHDAIAQSKLLGDVYLLKSKYSQYEVGKKISVQFVVTYQHDSSLKIVTPKVIS